MWRLLCPGWFRPRQALSNTRLGKSLASYNLADKAHALALGRTTKLGWALRSVVAAGALYATGHYVRVHRHVLLGLLYAARARAAPLARPFVAVSGMLTKKVLAVLAVAAVGSGCLYFQQAAATDGDGEEQVSADSPPLPAKEISLHACSCGQSRTHYLCPAPPHPGSVSPNLKVARFLSAGIIVPGA